MADECANPLLLGWLKEWMDEAQERNSKGFLVFVSECESIHNITNSFRYKKAYQSMKACPLKFHHPTEAQQLNGLGPKLCDRLTDKLKTYCTQNGLPMPEKAVPKTKKRNGSEGESEEPTQTAKKPRKTQLYVPKLRSGAYALIIALSQLDQDGNQALSKADLIEKAQSFSDSSFTVPSDPTKFYTAWKSMQTLESKELVCTRGHPTKKYYLSDEGWDVALRIKAAENGTKVTSTTRTSKIRNTEGEYLDRPGTSNSLPRRDLNTRDVLELSPSPEPEESQNPLLPKRIPINDSRNFGKDVISQGSSASSSDPVVLRPGTFEVKLILDNREVRTKTDRDYISNELKKYDVVPEIRALPLGDVLWIAKVTTPHDSAFKLRNLGDQDEGSDEIVLEHVVERKRLDDLIGSLKDGRFHEQKFRLKKSGVRHVTYLIEDYSISTEKSDKYGEAVESAIAAMQVVNDIFVKRTPKLDDTIRYLARMTKSLKEQYEKKELRVIPSRSLDISSYLSILTKLRDNSPSTPFCITFSAFCSVCDKSDSMTLRDIYLKLLMCTRGVTGDKAIEIQKIWNTPRALIEAYERAAADGKSKDTLISERLADKIPRKKVAKALSTKIAEVWAS